jgi:phenylalanyl-tRNA synthetase alpha chain
VEETLARLLASVRERLARVDREDDVTEIRQAILGRKGELTAILRGMSALPEHERPRFGKLANETREAIDALLAGREGELAAVGVQRRLAGETLDVTLPGRPVAMGGLHPITLVLEELKDVFLGMGYDIAEGPEVETDWYNFEALNIPKDHPAREMQDSFFITEDILLRTHTSPMQIRYMRRVAPTVPLRAVFPGHTYRRDDDATHSPMFNQLEVLAIDRGITLGDLKGTLLTFVRQLFGPDRRILLRPSYFPFTEPSAEVDVSCIFCDGAGCRACKGSGWLEILGAGMVHPRVLATGGYDPEKYSGFAAGLGAERIAMLKYGIGDMRDLFSNDQRVLAQFQGVKA